MILLLAVAGLLGLTFNYYGPGIICGKDYYSSNLPRDSPVLLPNGSALFPMQECQGYQLEEANIDDLQALLSSRALRSIDLVHCYESRIHQTSNYLGAVIQLNPDALEIAKRLDTERNQGNIRGPLHGIPFLVKDNIATKDHMETTAGSWALLGSVVPRDAHVVQQLRKAGAVLLGKTNLSEWADMRSSKRSAGYSARGGQCRNPYNLAFSPDGSSSGSAVAVAANLIPFALGTETDGSVINPAQQNAVVGIKPTVGLTSRSGIIPESINQDTIGSIGKTVRDVAYALDTIYGVDRRDSFTLEQRGKAPFGGYAQFMRNKTALQGAVFGLPWRSFWSLGDTHQISQLVELLELIQTAGATIINGTELPHYKTLVSPTGWDWDYGSNRGHPNESEYSYLKVDFYNNIKTYLAELDNTSMRSLEDLMDYNIRNAGSEGGYPGVHPAFESGQDGFEASLVAKGLMDETYWQALAYCQRTTREEGIDAALRYDGRVLDGLLVPPAVAQSAQIAAQAGYPVITIPAGINGASGVPYGLALMHSAYEEPTLIKYASAIEDLQVSTGTQWKRTQPEWRDFLARNIPVIEK